jgi:hypothetical protein
MARSSVILDIGLIIDFIVSTTPWRISFARFGLIGRRAQGNLRNLLRSDTLTLVVERKGR